MNVNLQYIKLLIYLYYYLLFLYKFYKEMTIKTFLYIYQ